MISRNSTRLLALSLALSGAVLATACLDTETPTVPSFKYQVSVSPDTLPVRKDSLSAPIVATLTNVTLNKQVDSTGLVYTSASTAIAKLTYDNALKLYRVTGVAPGTTVVRVSYLKAYQDSVVVTVAP